VDATSTGGGRPRARSWPMRCRAAARSIVPPRATGFVPTGPQVLPPGRQLRRLQIRATRRASAPASLPPSPDGRAGFLAECHRPARAACGRCIGVVSPAATSPPRPDLALLTTWLTAWLWYRLLVRPGSARRRGGRAPSPASHRAGQAALKARPARAILTARLVGVRAAAVRAGTATASADESLLAPGCPCGPNVRTAPGSRRHPPQVARAELDAWLPGACLFLPAGRNGSAGFPEAR